MSLRAHRFTDPPTKANRFAWAGCWIRHRRSRQAGPNSRLLDRLLPAAAAPVCAADPDPSAAPAAIPHTSQIPCAPLTH